ncbi:MAG: PASTA domain-containing protein [Clostridia bacterium]|nr:PASTA domain-containing protein [Clostridia bacterium]
MIAIDQWVRTLPLTAKRGQILDCNANILASTKTSYDLYVRSKEVDKPVELATKLSSLLNLKYDDVYKKVKNVSASENLIKLQISEDVALKAINLGYKGIYVAENISRIYPYGKLLSQTIGFLTSDSFGQSGVESFYNKILSGTNGKYLTQSDVRGISLDDSLKYYIKPTDGLNLKLTIDINIQNIVENVFEDIAKDHNPKSISAIILNPANSSIIAMAKYPTFDLNNIPRDNVEELMKLTKNTMVTDVYEPGSTFKIFTLAAALSEGLTNLNEKFYCPGFRIIDGQKIKCWKTTGHGSQTLEECVSNSCNCCFMDLALRLGKEKFYHYLKIFGIGNMSGVDIAGESAGLIIDLNLVKNVDLARIGFGHSVAVTQLQLVNSFCSLINGGTLYQPTLTESYLDCNKNTVFQNVNLISNKNLKNKQVSKDLCFLLERALSKNGDMTFIEGYKVAGKTGTAQKYGLDGKIESGKYVSSFFGFLNSNNDPQYALLLCVDEPSSGAYYGSVVAKPYAKQILEAIINYKNLPKDDDTVKSKAFEVPDFVGMSLSKSIAVLEEMGVYYEVDGEGGVVKHQFPSPTTIIDSSTSIIIST